MMRPRQNLNSLARALPARGSLPSVQIPRAVHSCHGFVAMRPEPSLALQMRSYASPADVFKLPASFQTFSTTLDSEALIKELNSQNAAFMLTKTTCPFCAKAKALFKDLGVTYSEFALDMLNSQEKKALAAHLREATGAGSVPRVYVGGKCLGGNSEVQHLHFAAELVPKLVAAGVVDPKIEKEPHFVPGNPNL
mmetsp:Transcript_12460/g.28205  ORF Transcript_12460/g.28205 Transcript_12460/m.28205 type:complete len:194 (+) Transcript_12460:72-653(+)